MNEFEARFKNRDLEWFRNLTPQQWDNEMRIVIYWAVEGEGWPELIELSRIKLEYWSWVIKNCFTVRSDCIELADRLFQVCPDNYKADVVERVRDYCPGMVEG